ncbi:MAG: stage II sporulation protein M, partial [Actinomycetota bacterium]
MDIDAFVATHQHTWSRLADLTARARKIRRLAPSELDELVALYQRAGSHLAHARLAYGADDAIVGRLTTLVADAHGVVYRQRETRPGRAVAQFLWITFPASMWRIRWFIVVA